MDATGHGGAASVPTATSSSLGITNFGGEGAMAYKSYCSPIYLRMSVFVYIVEVVESTKALGRSTDAREDGSRRQTK